MKGLLIKDLKLMKNQGWFFIMIVLISIGCAASMKNPFFAMGYATSLISVFSVSTIGYDEYDNGMLYLFTLPISRKLYVKEKYVYAILVTVVALVAAIGISAGVAFAMHLNYPIEEWLGIISSSVFIVSLIISIILPVRMKFDTEKNKMAILIAIGVVALVAVGIVKIAEMFNVDLEAFLDEVLFGSPVKMLLIVIGVGIILVVVSYLISVKIMEKREF